MGYRSDVRIITSKKGFDKLKNYISEYLKENKSDDNILDYLDAKKECKNFVYLCWDNIKWYDEYISVEAITKGLDDLEEKGYSYRISRFGEEYGDYEESYFDGEKDKNSNIPFAWFERKFDDDHIDKEIDYVNSGKDKKNSSEFDL